MALSQTELQAMPPTSGDVLEPKHSLSLSRPNTIHSVSLPSALFSSRYPRLELIHNAASQLVYMEAFPTATLHSVDFEP